MILTFALGVALSAAFVGLVLWYARHRGVIAHPTERSSHVVPTPTGGGLGLIVAFGIAVWIGTGAAGPSDDASLAALGVFLVAAVGWLDDHGGVPARQRLVVHTIAGLCLLSIVGDVSLPLPLGPLAIVAWVFWTVSAINVVNFLDGIDGLIATQGILFAGFCALAATPSGEAQGFALALLGACVGFLLWNWSPARIFLGDVGSGALGVLFVLGGALLVAEGRVSFVAAFAPLIPIFLDAAVTLARRARSGERLGEPHRSHLYQRLANSPIGHARVTIAYGIVSVGTGVSALLVPNAGLAVLAALLNIVAAIGSWAERRLATSSPPVLP